MAAHRAGMLRQRLRALKLIVREGVRSCAGRCSSLSLPEAKPRRQPLRLRPKLSRSPASTSMVGTLAQRWYRPMSTASPALSPAAPAPSAAQAVEEHAMKQTMSPGSERSPGSQR